MQDKNIISGAVAHCLKVYDSYPRGNCKYDFAIFWYTGDISHISKEILSDMKRFIHEEDIATPIHMKDFGWGNGALNALMVINGTNREGFIRDMNDMFADELTTKRGGGLIRAYGFRSFDKTA